MHKFPFELFFWAKNALRLLSNFVKYFNYNKLIDKKFKIFYKFIN